MKRVLVTGATGLIGRHAIQDLVTRGYEVHGVSRTRPVDDTSGVIWHEADLLDPGEAQRIVKESCASYLLHLAWVTEHGEFWSSLDNKLWLTVSQRLIDAFVEAGGERVVVSGSCAEYDWNALGDGICRETETPLNPHTLYGQCKVALYKWLMSREDISSAWGRVFFLYGEGESPKRLVPDVALALIEGREAKCSSGRQVRDFLDAESVAQGFVALLLSDVHGAVNVASGEARTIADIANLLGDVTCKPELVKLGAFPDRPDDPASIVADVTRLTKEVGYTSSNNLRDSLEEFVTALSRH